MTVVLRAFRDDDGPALLAVHVGAILATSDSHYSAAERESWAHGLTEHGYARARNDGETFVLAESDSLVVGFCSWDDRQICGLYVAPAAQGKGIGALLLAAGERALLDQGVKLSRIHSSLPAIGFYQAHGYAIVSRSRFPSRGGLIMDDAMLEKALA